MAKKFEHDHKHIIKNRLCLCCNKPIKIDSKGMRKHFLVCTKGAKNALYAAKP